MHRLGRPCPVTAGLFRGAVRRGSLYRRPTYTGGLHIGAVATGGLYIGAVHRGGLLTGTVYRGGLDRGVIRRGTTPIYRPPYIQVVTGGFSTSGYMDERSWGHIPIQPGSPIMNPC